MAETLKSLKRKRASVKARVTAFRNFVHGISTNLDDDNYDETVKFELSDRIIRIQEALIEFNKYQSEIEELVEDSDLEGELVERTSFEDSFLNKLAIAKKILNDLEVHKINNSPIINEHNDQLNQSTLFGENIHLKMPDWKLPQFDGTDEKWSVFYETFKSAVHTNNKLPTIKKFQYLTGALEGKAAQIIQGLPMTSDNYEIAWGLIEKRYENKTLRIHNHIKQIVDFPKLGKESGVSLRQLLDSLEIHHRALRALDQPVDSWDNLIIYLVSEKLDFYTKKEWEKWLIDDNNEPTFKIFIEFLDRKCLLLEKLGKQDKSSNDQKSRNSNKSGRGQVAAHASSVTPSKCLQCNEQHEIYKCPAFLKLSIQERVAEVKKQKRCFSCLRTNHISSECKSAKRCRKCNQAHNTLLHIEKPSCGETSAETESEQVVSNFSKINQTSYVLPTAKVKIVGRNGEIHEGTALLDSGSQSNFMTVQFCKKLGLPVKQTNIPVVGINEATSRILEKTTAEIRSIHTDLKTQLSFMVIPHITTNLPSESLNLGYLKLPKNIPLADPQFHIRKQIDILIGVDFFWELLCPEAPIHPYLHRTQLGYVVSGKIDNQCHKQRSTACNLSTIDLSHQLKMFWEIEDCGDERPRSLEEEACELDFIKHTKRTEQGRFIVSIPMKGNVNSLGNSRAMAEHRFKLLEKRFKRNESLKQRYTEFMNEYIALGHMSKLSEDLVINVPHYYLPHHGVLKEDSSTTKLRVVFDGSAPTSTGVSFNDLQMVGPTLQPELFLTLLQFRLYKYVVGADIKMMYRQILITEPQRLLQLILWRSDPSQNLETWQLNTVTYGLASSPYLAIRCLFELADEIKSIHPKLSELIRKMYVDDFVCSFQSKQEAIETVKLIVQILAKAGFELRKWISNNTEILENVQGNKTTNKLLTMGQHDISKTLGLSWLSSQDKLIYNVNLDVSNKPTKRIVLSCIARLFDPLGLLSPCLILAKIILQELWKLKVAWDDPLPTDLKTKWEQFTKELPSLNDLRIQRQVCYSNIFHEVHIFSDASKLAYGACVYSRSMTSTGGITVHLFCSKTRVAPLPTKGAKLITIPRLELCAALIAARLFVKLQKILPKSFGRTTLWCDSTIVLGWLRKDPARLTEFVGHRISEIQHRTADCEWRHVASQDNPADLLSRGVKPTQLSNSKLWWNGPPWLSQDESYWPQNEFVISTLPEVKMDVMIVTIPKPNLIMFENYSNASRLERIIAWCFRFYYNSKSSKNTRQTGSLTLTEINRANLSLIRMMQRENFSRELEILSQSQLDHNHKLLKLTPFIHTDGTLRVGGRLHKAKMKFDKRHPLIISAKHPFTKLLFQREHVKLLHAGPQSLLASTRDRYWTISGRNLARKVVHSCVKCFRCNPKPIQPIMGNLPADRVNPAPPFYITGVDYAGPILMRDRKGRGVKFSKGYICLFICFVTKAIHLELVSDLTTNAFILTLRRFAARRGMPAKIHSDNGLNFVGAHNELRELGNFLRDNETEIQDRLVQENFNWSFIPSYSPHFGGLWEAGVKSTKYHLKRVVGNATLIYEELYTVLTQIEAILNSRPLTPLSSNAIDYEPLTPGHFLIGRPLTSVPDPDVTHIQENRLSDYQRIQQIQQHFWKRWTKEYISELQCRTKWREQLRHLKGDALVIIKDNNIPPLKWLLGRVVKTHPGTDGITRVVDIRTKNGIIQRSVTKICPLPISL